MVPFDCVTFPQHLRLPFYYVTFSTLLPFHVILWYLSTVLPFHSTIVYFFYYITFSLAHVSVFIFVGSILTVYTTFCHVARCLFYWKIILIPYAMTKLSFVSSMINLYTTEYNHMKSSFLYAIFSWFFLTLLYVMLPLLIYVLRFL